MTGTEIAPLALPASQVPAVFARGPKAERRFWEFFITQLASDKPGQVCAVPFSTDRKAKAALERQRSDKVRRGYVSLCAGEVR
jgi:hypothetical protein